MAWGKKPTKAGPFVVGSKLIYDTAHTVEICSICYDEYADTSLKPCNHTSCTSCLLEWRSKTIMKSQAGTTCPFCRTVIKKTIILKNSYDLNNQKKNISDSATKETQKKPHLLLTPEIMASTTSTSTSSNIKSSSSSRQTTGGDNTKKEKKVLSKQTSTKPVTSYSSSTKNVGNTTSMNSTKHTNGDLSQGFYININQLRKKNNKQSCKFVC